MSSKGVVFGKKAGTQGGLLGVYIYIHICVCVTFLG